MPTSNNLESLRQVLEKYARDVLQRSRNVKFPVRDSRFYHRRSFDVLYDMTDAVSVKQVHDTLIKVYTYVQEFDNLFPIDIVPVVRNETQENLSSWSCTRHTYRYPRNEDILKAFAKSSIAVNSSKDNQTIYMSRLMRTFTMYEYIALGGTFDHLHAGHKVLLTVSTLFSNDRLKIGVTSDKMASKKQYTEYLESLEDRQDAVLRFVQKIRPNLRYVIDTINDSWGGTHLTPHLKALVVTSETLSAGKMINDLRLENGLLPVQIICSDLIKTHGNRDEKISSTMIRKLMYYHNSVEK